MSANKLNWTSSGVYQVAPTRHPNKVGILFWRIWRLPSGRWDADGFTSFALGDSKLERWSTFESAEAAKLWCEAADERLAGGVP